MVSDLLEENGDLRKQSEQMKQRIADLEDENESLKTLIKEIKSDVKECFGFEYNILVAKLLNKWEVKER
jgi:cell division septum initiation protein DivIVA